MSALAPAYLPHLPRRPTETVLYGLVRQDLEPFLAYAREHYDDRLPRYVENELRAYRKCGVFSEGFVRWHCDACGHDLLVAFSGKSRAACPSCGGRRMALVFDFATEVKKADPSKQALVDALTEGMKLPRECDAGGLAVHGSFVGGRRDPRIHARPERRGVRRLSDGPFRG